MNFKDHFSDASENYKKYRPDYPDELFAFLAKQPSSTAMAWDCATGNGQAAAGLAPYFETVIATDASKCQVHAAPTISNVRFQVATAEQSNLPDCFADLITVAQAFHWFNPQAFFNEANRVLKPGGTLAIWFYQLAKVTPEIDTVIQEFYTGPIDAYWPPERRFIDAGYSHVEMPFEAVTTPEFSMSKNWTLEDMMAYLSTWSAVKKYTAQKGENPLPALHTRLAPMWKTIKPVSWPLHILISRKVEKA